MISLSATELLELQLAKSLGLDRYAELLNAAKMTDVSLNPEFQRSFNGFYRVRRNKEWRDCYYRLFEIAKANYFGFADIIGFLFVETGNVEASFSSKMLAMIDPEKPIWDQYVLQNLGLELKGKTPPEKVRNAVAVYQQIQEWYAGYLKSDQAKGNIAEFNRVLPDYAWISDVKKIDYLLWSKRV